jgi:hypothetical protein
MSFVILGRCVSVCMFFLYDHILQMKVKGEKTFCEWSNKGNNYTWNAKVYSKSSERSVGYCVGFELPTAVTMKSVVPRFLMPCSLERAWCFWGRNILTLFFRVKWYAWQETSSNQQQCSAGFLLGLLLSLKMEAVCSSDTSDSIWTAYHFRS